MSNRKVYVVGNSYHYVNWMESRIVNKMEDADFCCMTGGEDVSPYLYEKNPHYSTNSNDFRDTCEVHMFQHARSFNKPIIGICRGAQFLCVMAGGILVQDQDNPNYLHKIITNDGRIIFTTSTHHQAQYPWELPKNEYKVLGWSEEIQSSYHMGEDDGDELVFDKVKDEKEVEICYYPKIRGLSIQGHPESMMSDFYKNNIDVRVAIAYYRELLNKLLNNTL